MKLRAGFEYSTHRMIVFKDTVEEELINNGIINLFIPRYNLFYREDGFYGFKYFKRFKRGKRDRELNFIFSEDEIDFEQLESFGSYRTNIIFRSHL